MNVDKDSEEDARGANAAADAGRGRGLKSYFGRQTQRASLVDDSPAAARPIFADAEAMKEKLRQNMSRPQYSVANFYHEHGVFQAIARSPLFEKITLFVIGFNALWIWIDTDYNHEVSLLQAAWPFQAVEQFFCCYFSFEITVRFQAFKRKRNCLRDAWFVFDSFMVTMMVFETWIMTILILVILGESGTGPMGNASMMRLLRLLRLSRMARMARLLRAMPELLILIKGMIAAMRSVFFTLLLLLVLIYVFGIAFVQLLSDETVARRGFETVPEAMHTLLLKGTLMDEISMIVRQLSHGGQVYVVLFYFFVLISALTVMNMLIGVLCEVVNAVAATEREELTVSYVRSRLQDVLKQGGLDTDGDGLISKDEFAQILANTHAVRTLQDVGVDVFNLVDLQEFIFQEDDESGGVCEKQLEFPEFMELVLALRGSNQATVKDVVDLRKFIIQRTKELETRVLNGMKKNSQSSTTASTTSKASAGSSSQKNSEGRDRKVAAHAPEATSLFPRWEVISETEVLVKGGSTWQSVTVGSKAPQSNFPGSQVGDWVQLPNFEGYVSIQAEGGERAQITPVQPETPGVGAKPASAMQILEQFDREMRAARQTMLEEFEAFTKRLGVSDEKLGSENTGPAPTFNPNEELRSVAANGKSEGEDARSFLSLNSKKLLAMQKLGSARITPQVHHEL